MSFAFACSRLLSNKRDEISESLRKKYAPKIAALQEKIRKAEQAVERETSQAKQAGMQTAVSFGATLLGAFVGRKKVSSSTLSKATTAMRRAWGVPPNSKAMLAEQRKT